MKVSHLYNRKECEFDSVLILDIQSMILNWKAISINISLILIPFNGNCVKMNKFDKAYSKVTNLSN